MITTALIAFREFLEAFLIAGVFLGLSKQLNLKKEFEILLAVACGVVLSLLLATGTYLFAGSARSALSESSAELLSAFLMIFSGVFIAYVVFSLHRAMKGTNMNGVSFAKDVMKETGFDITFFFLIIFLILREGFEVALFTGSVSLFSDFAQNIAGLWAGFSAAAVAGTVVYLAYTKLPLGKIFAVTEYAIILMGGFMTASGVVKLVKGELGVDLSSFVSVPVPFIADAVIGIVPIGIVAAYIGIVYFLFIRSKPAVSFKRST